MILEKVTFGGFNMNLMNGIIKAPEVSGAFRVRSRFCQDDLPYVFSFRRRSRFFRRFRNCRDAVSYTHLVHGHRP